MQPTLLDGKGLASRIRNSLKKQLQDLIGRGHRIPILATVLVGNAPASATYVRMKLRACEEVGLGSRRIELPDQTTTEELLQAIDGLNADPEISGILLQHPVPAHINERAAFDRIALAKDVDGVTASGFGKMALGLPAFPACTPAGIIRLMDAYNIPIEGRHAVVVGRSPIVGRPMALLLLQRNATVTVCHSRTRDLAAHLVAADIVIAACGQPRLVRGELLKNGVTVIDAGYNSGNVGDTDHESCLAKAAYITPVPGGVGPMTIAMLLEHSLQAAFPIIPP